MSGVLLSTYLGYSPAGKELAVFGTVVRQMLGDVQQRLIFMAQVGPGWAAWRIVCVWQWYMVIASHVASIPYTC